MFPQHCMYTQGKNHHPTALVKQILCAQMTQTGFALKSNPILFSKTKDQSLEYVTLAKVLSLIYKSQMSHGNLFATMG